MIIKGLTQDNYLINNPILIDIERKGSFYLKVTNKRTQESSTLSLSTPPNGKITYNLSPIIKAMFHLPNEESNYVSSRFINNTIADFELMFYQPDGLSFRPRIFNKTFIRGGYYNNQKNISLPKTKILSPIGIVPYWDNYPVAEYTLKPDLSIFQSNAPIIYKNINVDTFKNGQRQINRTCKGIYLKFLNSLGGYSYWLFENKKEIRNTKSTFQINNLNTTYDNGVEITNDLEVSSRVAIEFIPLINDLIHSPEVYFYEQFVNGRRERFTRIYIGDNKLELNDYQQIQEVTINLKKFTNYTPTI